MRQGHYEIEIINPEDGSKFEERRVNGKHYVVAVPGKEYKIRVTLHNPENLFPRDKYIRLNLNIDGQSVGYCKTFKPDHLIGEKVTHVFDGFRQTTGVSSSIFCAFTFTDVTFNAPATNFSRNYNPDVGFVSLSVFCGDGERMKDPANNSFYTPTAAKNIINENSKFWQQASASTQVGRSIGPFIPGRPTVLYQNRECVKKMRLGFHTAAVLDLMERDCLNNSSCNNSNNLNGKASAGATPPSSSGSTTEVADTEVEEVNAKKRKIQVVDLCDE